MPIGETETPIGRGRTQVRLIKDNDGKVMTDQESVLRIWKEYYKGLVNEENEREGRENDGERVNLEVEKISKEEVRENMKRMKNGKAVAPDDIPVEVWKYIGEIALEFLAKLYNRTMKSEMMPEELRDSVLIPIFENNGDLQSCIIYRGIKLVSHTVTLWERVVERRLRSDLTFNVRFHAREKHYRCIVCFESFDGEVQRRSKGATLCVCGPGESL